MKTWFNFLSLSYTAGTQQVSWGKKGEKGGCFRKTNRKLARAGASFFETPSKKQRRNSLGNMPSTYTSKKD
jgi:hypothetical protein